MSSSIEKHESLTPGSRYFFLLFFPSFRLKENGGERLGSDDDNNIYMNVVAEVYPPPPSTAYPSSGPYVAPPPAGYPMKDAPNPQNPPPVETKSRGEGFWKGWYVETGNLYIFISDIQLVALKGQNHTCLNFSNLKKKKKNPQQ